MHDAYCTNGPVDLRHECCAVAVAVSQPLRYPDAVDAVAELTEHLDTSKLILRRGFTHCRCETRSGFCHGPVVSRNVRSLRFGMSWKEQMPAGRRLPSIDPAVAILSVIVCGDICRSEHHEPTNQVARWASTTDRR